MAIIGFNKLSHSQKLHYPVTGQVRDTVQVFGENSISNGLANRDFTISPSGNEMLYTIQLTRFLSSTILCIRQENGKWGKPEVASFSGIHRDLEASFSPDGNTIYFSSDRPVDVKDSVNDFDIWKVVRTADGKWGQPQHLGFTVNSPKNEFYASVAKSGNIYFTVQAKYGKGGEDIVMCNYRNGAYDPPTGLPEAINSGKDEFNAFVDPDEQFILFSSYGRADDLGGGDLYMSTKDATGNWTTAKHLPAPINSAWLDYCPFVSPDKNAFFFSSNRVNPVIKNKIKKEYQQLMNLVNGPGNGADDIYWIKFDAVR